ncbi:MAG: septum formation protein Maf [Halobacteriovoraceae bacterium]|nr:septum formation protein Maf [Halobacteriovoraceae bacterium]|tara:strand:+ start:259641 stop:260219 length:579 start_codon:yes stop_codon:yes gene_type:complete
MSKIILASSSPYRKALLERLNFEFECISPDLDEDAYKAKISDPIKLAETLAFEKANVIFKQHPDSIVIGSDQLVDFEGEILGKAGNLDNAFQQLKRLSGKPHNLITSYCVLSKGKKHIQTVKTTLTMRQLNDEQIKKYLRNDNPIDCAGSYKLELKGISLFDKIETDDHTAIVGLPLLSLGTYLSEIGLSIP